MPSPWMRRCLPRDGPPRFRPKGHTEGLPLTLSLAAQPGIVCDYTLGGIQSFSEVSTSPAAHTHTRAASSSDGKLLQAYSNLHYSELRCDSNELLPVWVKMHIGGNDRGCLGLDVLLTFHFLTWILFLLPCLLSSQLMLHVITNYEDLMKFLQQNISQVMKGWLGIGPSCSVPMTLYWHNKGQQAIEMSRPWWKGFRFWAKGQLTPTPAMTKSTP